MTNIDLRKNTIRQEWESARTEFHTLIDPVSVEDWCKRSFNPAWTNGQVLFHITLGFIIVLVLHPMVRLFAHMPHILLRAFAAFLNISTPLFNLANALGPHLGARLYARRALGRKYDSIHNAILKRLESDTEETLKRGIFFPTRWDKRFELYMTIEQLYHYPTAHFKHHAKQLNLPPK